jgi:hypothetical protein
MTDADIPGAGTNTRRKQAACSPRLRVGIPRVDAIKMPSTPFAYPQIISRTFASFHVLNPAFPQLSVVSVAGSIPGSSTQK